MQKMSLMNRILAMSEEEKSKYLPDKKYELYSNIQEGDILIKNVPHISYTANTLKSSFVPPEVEKVIANYLHDVDTNISSSYEPKSNDSVNVIIDYSEILERSFATH